MKQQKIFINLSAGLLQKEHIGEIIRIQSSHLESHSFDRLFYGLSDSLLYHLANGFHCCVIDCSSNSVGKVIKRGIPIIKAILEWRWLKIEKHKLGKDYFKRIKISLSRQTKNKIDYFKKFQPKIISLEGISCFIEKESLNAL